MSVLWICYEARFWQVADLRLRPLSTQSGRSSISTYHLALAGV
jgi:hypothetical protein